ncbi:hypothetical protein AJ79_06305 [Helicocarpus griseus UAMH5409]|uniref:Uncharacterized protein n=1 Tax=Helicocarpus griseus UAMH5409 TaxID=1447875 RepID=A0A2B7XF85_9EURO|nr:hypothetical protein AJ79_06305 [Helicocarpus griseus UAMH5409]
MKSIKVPLAPQGDPDDERHISPLWQTAIAKYRQESKRADAKSPRIDPDIWSSYSSNGLLQHTKDLVSVNASAFGSWMRLWRKLESVLLDLNDYMALFALVLGTSCRVAAILWGSVRLIFKLVPSRLPGLLDVFEELDRALPRFRQYKRNFL